MTEKSNPQNLKSEDSARAVGSQWSVVSKCVFSFALSAMFFALCSFASAQQQGKVVRIGEIVFRSRPDFGPGRTAFRQQLRELGYVDGKNIAFESRSAEGKLDRYRTLADELVRLRVDVLFASSADEALTFKNATTAIPIVFHVTTDPICGWAN